jgi:hypothetical protein
MRISLLVTLLIFLITSCKKHGPADAAFFIKTTTPLVITKKSTEGSGSNKITDLFLYVNGQYQGAYPVGNLMPIVTKGQPVRINVFAGIKNNGIGETRIAWNFYQYLQIDTLVESGKTIERPFHFNYNQDVKFDWIEDFDNPTATTIINSAISNSAYQIAGVADSYEGRSLKLEIDANSNGIVAQVESSGAHALPAGSSNVYLELDYKSNQVFEVGLFGGPELKAALMVNPSANWNKIYIQLSNAVSNAPVYDTYKVYFKVLKTAENNNPKLFLDNIKLIHFQ